MKFQPKLTMKFQPQPIHIRVARKFKKLPIPVEAVQLEEAEEIETLEGKVKGKKGDWKVTGPEGESWPIDKKVFEKTYMPLDEEAESAWKDAYGEAYEAYEA